MKYSNVFVRASLFALAIAIVSSTTWVNQENVQSVTQQCLTSCASKSQTKSVAASPPPPPEVVAAPPPPPPPPPPPDPWKPGLKNGEGHIVGRPNIIQCIGPTYLGGNDTRNDTYMTSAGTNYLSRCDSGDKVKWGYTRVNCDPFKNTDSPLYNPTIGRGKGEC